MNNKKRNKWLGLLIYIHWLTMLLILLVYFTIETRSFFGKETLYHDIMMVSHFYIGMVILFITILRLIIIPFTGLSKMSPKTINKYQKLCSKFVHIFLYAFLIITPILGWFILSASGKSIPFGLPNIIPYNLELRNQLKDIHIFIANFAVIIIFIHACAALYHHYVLKNNVLKNMSLKKK